MTFLAKAWPWIWERRQLFGGLFIGIALGLWLAPKPECPQLQASAVANQGQAGAAKGDCGQRVVIKTVPGQCPEIQLESQASAQVHGSQGQTATAEVSAGPGYSASSMLYFGGEYRSDGLPALTASFGHDRFLADASINTAWGYSVGVKWAWWKF